MSDKLIYIADMDNEGMQLIKHHLESCNYRVKVFDNGEKLAWECNYLAPDLIIMDIKLHEIDGLEVCRRLRQEELTRLIPILILSDRKEEFDVVLGLEIGADDYMIKPCSIRELQSRIKAITRRVKSEFHSCPADTDILRINNLTLDIQGRSVYNGSKSIRFALKEFELLKLMAMNMNKVLTRKFILEKIWDSDYYSGTRTVDVHIRNIRRKLYELDNEHSYIECVRRSGYRFNDKRMNIKVG